MTRQQSGTISQGNPRAELLARLPVHEILSGLNITTDERSVIEQRLHELVRERAAGKRSALLTNPVHVGVGTK